MNKMGLSHLVHHQGSPHKNEYITNMGWPDVARIKRDADVAAAEADRDTAIKRALAQRESAVARAQADQERAGRTACEAGQKLSDLEVKKAQYLKSQRQQAQADKAYDIQTNIMQQVVAEQVKVQQIE
jgi:flotillin